MNHTPSNAGLKRQPIRLVFTALILAALVAAFWPAALSLRAAAFEAADEAELVTAITAANAAGSGAHEITLTADITLTGALPALNNATATSITVVGNGHTLTGDGAHTVLVIAPGTTVTIEDVTVTGGAGSSGSEGTGGGGIFNQGTLTILDSIVTGNAAVRGGGLLNESTGNTVAATIVLSSTLTANTATNGGAIANRSAGSLASVNLDRVTVSDNSATAGGGGIDNAATGSGNAQLVVVRALISGNESDRGGGIATQAGDSSLAKLSLLRTQLTGNSSTSGGGLASTSSGNGRSESFITQVTFDTNQTTGDGGSVFQESAGGTTVLVATNLTVSGNTAGGQGGGIAANANGGSSAVRLTYATIAGNAAATGQNLSGATSGGTTTVTIGSSIMSASDADCALTGAVIVSNGFNIGSDTTCALTAPTDLTGVDPQLEPLALNLPGSTPTRALAANSPAIDRVTYSYNGCGTDTLTDQRGAARLQGIKCDSGAYERDQPALNCQAPYSADSDASLNEAILCLNAAGAGSHALAITSPITLAGPSAPLTNADADEIVVTGNSHVVNGDGRGTVFTVGPATTVTMSNLTVTGGAGSSWTNRSSGGGFYVRGNLALTQVTVEESSAHVGGGIFLDGDSAEASLTLQQVTLRNNSATQAGGAVAVTGNDGSANAAITSSLITGNTSNDTGGGLDIGGYDGAAVVTVQDTTFSGNTAKIGGAAFVNGNGSTGSAALEVARSTFSANSATNAGAIGINGNSGTATVALRNSTVSGNNGDKSGGAIINSGNGGTASFTARFATFADNTSPSASLLQNGSGATTTFTASILVGSETGSLCLVNGGTIASGNYNVANDDSCGLNESADVEDGTADLLPLAANAPGTTRTHALGQDSDARNRVPGGSAGCGSDVLVDQRGIARPQPAEGQCDSGSFEVVEGAPPAGPQSIFLPIVVR